MPNSKCATNSRTKKKCKALRSKKKLWQRTPVRPLRMPVYYGPDDPDIEAQVAVDDTELEARILRSPNYEGPKVPTADFKKTSIWKDIVDGERIVQLRELKIEVSLLQQELKLACKFMNHRKLFKKKILRLFPSHGIYEGTITGWKKPYFKICYEEDKDEEELDADEVVKHLIV